MAYLDGSTFPDNSIYHSQGLQLVGVYALGCSQLLAVERKLLRLVCVVTVSP